MPLINAFRNPDQPSPHTTDITIGFGTDTGYQSISVPRGGSWDELGLRINAAVEAHRRAARTEREGPSPGGWSGWVTSEGHSADFPRVELTLHHPERALLDRTERTDQRRYRLVGLRDQLTALQRPLAVLANEGASIARDGVGEWSSEQVDALVRVSDLEAEVETLLEALRELF